MQQQAQQLLSHEASAMLGSAMRGRAGLVNAMRESHLRGRDGPWCRRRLLLLRPVRLKHRCTVVVLPVVVPRAVPIGEGKLYLKGLGGHLHELN